jgi:DNA-binding MarR family transcriptional regulator
MTGPNEIIHQSVRLRIMASLNALPQGDAIEFTRLKTLTSATDGNLGSHLDALERAGYVAIEKRFAGKKPQTRIRATPAGRRAFTEHVAYLREILDQAGPAA